MRFGPSFLDEIRDRVPISTIVGRRVSFDRKKSNPAKGDMWACCPFHGEKSPSFHCEDRKGRYHCFGCGVSGDHFRFLTELEGLSFPEAVETVAEIAGVPMPARDPEAEKREKEQASLFDVMELAVRFFEEQLQTNNGAKARAYLRERGLSTATQQQFRLGYAPDSRNALKEYLASKGIEKGQIEACGLVVFGEEIPVSYDRFRNRLMFPIQDSKGRVIAFGGRALSENDKAKYLNSPETELFHKGKTLFNLNRAKDNVSDGSEIVVVEGYMDVISLFQAGFPRVVAPMGTALTEDQIKLLWRYSKSPVMCFDGDAAGVRAANRIIETLLPILKTGHTAKFIALPDGKDPDDLVKEGGRVEFSDLLGKAIPLYDQMFSYYFGGGDFSSPDRWASSESSLNEALDKIEDQLIKRYYKSHFRLRLFEHFSSRKKRDPKVAQQVVSELSKDIDRAQKVILGLCVEYPGLISEYVEQLSAMKFKNNLYNLFFAELHRMYVEFDNLNIEKIYENIDQKFIFVLDAIHGQERIKIGRPNSSGHAYQYELKRGYKIREYFPLVNSYPTYELISMIMRFFILSINIVEDQTEFLNTAGKMEFLEVEARMRQLAEQKAYQSELKQWIELEISAQTGRQSYAA